MFQGCIFDLDGVIVDTAKYHFLAWRRLANTLGFDFDEAQNEKLKGVSRVESLNLILQWGGVEKTGQEKQILMDDKNGWYLEYIDKMTPEEILPGVIDFLTDLKQKNIKIGLGSASKNAGRILERIGLTGFFDTIVDGNQVTASKPDPEVFLKGAENLRLSPGDCIVFEDAEKGIEAAINGGFRAVGVGKKEQLPAAHLVIGGFQNVTFDDIVKNLKN